MSNSKQVKRTKTEEVAPRFVDVVLPLPVRRSFSYRLPADIPTPAPGSRVRVPFGSTVETGIVLGALKQAQLDPALRRAPRRLKEVSAVLDPEPWLDAPLLRLARWMEGYYGATLGETLKAMIAVKPLGRPRIPPPPELPERTRPLKLNDDQVAALARVTRAIVARRFAPFLLHGVTGSGKTEIYLQAIAEILTQGRQAIVLVPEISLTPQMARRFRARLGERVGIFHSGLSASERFAVWKAAREGTIDVVLGPRSAVFTPFRHLGLIVIDEEHDGSYKQTEKPRYHARSVALVRARDLGAAVILGSATPSLESLHNVRKGKYALLPLPRRIAKSVPAPIRVVDMSESKGTELSDELSAALERCLERGEKAILLLNRRGHSRLRLCRDCGEVIHCPRCDIPLTYHSRNDKLVCHYCGLERLLSPNCPSCGSGRWVLLGAGTQQLELELTMRFPDLPVFRMDMDSTRRKGAHQSILEAFAGAGPSLLLGTQMIAKGHHFPDVTLVGVINADTGLFVPDFRAAERSCQLLTQVAGRAGRGKRAGEVIIQTFNPEHPVLAALAESNTDALFEAELRDRRLLGYPPFRPLLSLLVSCPEEEIASQAAETLLRAFREQWPDHPADMLGPVPAFLPKIKERYRWQILVKGRMGREQKLWFSEYFPEIAKKLKRSGSLALEIDVDPESIL
ncbi:MAG: primosomal protein N' [bacterium]|nr:primosomal protein N' [bacterium]